MRFSAAFSTIESGFRFHLLQRWRRAEMKCARPGFRRPTGRACTSAFARQPAGTPSPLSEMTRDWPKPPITA